MVSRSESFAGRNTALAQYNKIYGKVYATYCECSGLDTVAPCETVQNLLAGTLKTDCGSFRKSLIPKYRRF